MLFSHHPKQWDENSKWQKSLNPPTKRKSVVVFVVGLGKNKAFMGGWRPLRPFKDVFTVMSGWARCTLLQRRQGRYAEWGAVGKLSLLIRMREGGSEWGITISGDFRERRSRNLTRLLKTWLRSLRFSFDFGVIICRHRRQLRGHRNRRYDHFASRTRLIIHSGQKEKFSVFTNCARFRIHNQEMRDNSWSSYFSCRSSM